MNHIQGDKNKINYLRTGDLGFLHQNELFICGRLKDVIIIDGSNHYPQDIEDAVVNCDEKIKPGSVIAYSELGETTEHLNVVIGIKRLKDTSQYPALVSKIELAISKENHLVAENIYLVPPKEVPKTSSGKLQRRQCAENIEGGLIKPLYHYNHPAFEKDDKTTKKSKNWWLVLQNTRKEERQTTLQAFLLETISEMVSIEDAKAVSVDKGLFDLGFDSIKAVELKSMIENNMNQQVHVDESLVFDYPTVRKISEYILHESGLVVKEKNEEETSPATHETSGNEDIAIIGMSCEFPGAANVAEFWDLLKEGRDAISDVPAERFDVNKYYDETPNEPGKMITKRAGFIEDIDKFDASFFCISPKEAKCLDPQQRLLLKHSWWALENAGVSPKSLYDSDTSVFVGISTYDYHQLITNQQDKSSINPYVATGNTGSTASGRISYFLGLKGPCLAVDTACSSSLVAIDEACRQLGEGNTKLAIAGGVNIILGPDLFINFSQAGMLSPDGKCKTFDENADGYVRGEGCGVVILKRLSDAQRSQDPILAVIKGSGINQDGASTGLTVPNGPSQEKLLKRVLKKANLKSADVDYVECHGTGTSLGDPIEAQALDNVYGQG